MIASDLEDHCRMVAQALSDGNIELAKKVVSDVERSTLYEIAYRKRPEGHLDPQTLAIATVEMRRMIAVCSKAQRKSNPEETS